jgi:hypothetical protein
LVACMHYSCCWTSHGKRIQGFVMTPPTLIVETIAFQQHWAAKVNQDLPNLSSIPTTLGARLISSQLRQLNSMLIKNQTCDHNHHTECQIEDRTSPRNMERSYHHASRWNCHRQCIPQHVSSAGKM